MFIAYLRKGQRSTVWNPLSATRTSLSCHRRNAATCHSRGGGAKNKCDPIPVWQILATFDLGGEAIRIYNFYILLPWFRTFRRALPIHPFFLGYSMPLDRITSSVFGQPKPRSSRSTKPIWKTNEMGQFWMAMSAKLPWLVLFIEIHHISSH